MKLTIGDFVAHRRSPELRGLVVGVMVKAAEREDAPETWIATVAWANGMLTAVTPDRDVDKAESFQLPDKLRHRLQQYMDAQARSVAETTAALQVLSKMTGQATKALHCKCCKGGYDPTPCRDPQCGDSTWDHECPSGYEPCPGLVLA